MNKEQYNNIIENTLHNNLIKNCDSCLTTAKNILNKMGIPLPNGNFQDIFNILQTNNYMGWRLCTLHEAQISANKGIPAIGISKNKISILKGSGEQSPALNNEAVISLTESTDIYSVADMLFYGFTAMRTSGDQYGRDDWESLDAAMNYYGRDFTYTYCGGYYNYYYTFTNGTKMYFRVP